MTTTTFVFPDPPAQKPDGLDKQALQKIEAIRFFYKATNSQLYMGYKSYEASFGAYREWITFHELAAWIAAYIKANNK